MPGSPTDPADHVPDGEPPPSIRDTMASFAQGLQQYLLARGELLSIESREAGRHATRKAILGVALACAAIFAYGLFLCAAVSLVGGWIETRFSPRFDQIGWQCVALAAGLLHVLLALVLLHLLRRKPVEPLFDVTRREFQKDRQWLHDQQTRENENNS